MASTTDPVLTWLRDLMQRRKINTAALATRTGLSRGRLRRLLSGGQPMLVDELMRISTALEISPADMGMPHLESPKGDESPESPEGDEDPEPSESEGGSVEPLHPEPPQPGVDPFGNHAEQLFQIAFALGCDFLFTADISQLGDSGIPEGILEQYRHPGTLLIKLDAMYHRANAPRFHEDSITLTLSFDGLYDCTFPWSAIRQITLDVARDEPEPEDEDEDGGGDKTDPGEGRPRLRLVT